MKLKFKHALTLLVVLVSLGTNPINAIPLFQASDTLILETEKHVGYGMIGGGYWRLRLEEIADTSELIKVIPQGVSNPKYTKDYIDFKSFWYGKLKKKNSEHLGSFLKENYPERIDTSNLLLETDNTVKLLVGTKGEGQIYIVDENNNNDFRDDSIRVLSKMSLETSAPEPVKCQYRIYNGKEIVKGSSWVFVKKESSDEVWISVAHHLKSTFILNDEAYEIQCVNGPPFFRFSFDNPKISVTTQKGVKKDSLLLSEILTIGEYLKLGESYYKFEKITNDGSKITLIKEEDVSDKIGNQVGFIAPDFRSVTTEGDSVFLADYKNKYLLLVNITACFSQPMSYEYYKELSEAYRTKIALLAIDESPGALQANIDQLGLNGKFVISKNNQSIKKSYREDFCSRVCFLIDPSGHIIDKFEISDWKKFLTKHFK